MTDKPGSQDGERKAHDCRHYLHGYCGHEKAPDCCYCPQVCVVWEPSPAPAPSPAGEEERCCRTCEFDGKCAAQLTLGSDNADCTHDASIEYRSGWKSKSAPTEEPDQRRLICSRCEKETTYKYIGEWLGGKTVGGWYECLDCGLRVIPVTAPAEPDVEPPDADRVEEIRIAWKRDEALSMPMAGIIWHKNSDVLLSHITAQTQTIADRDGKILNLSTRPGQTIQTIARKDAVVEAARIYIYGPVEEGEIDEINGNLRRAIEAHDSGGSHEASKI